MTGQTYRCLTELQDCRKQVSHLIEQILLPAVLGAQQKNFLDHTVQVGPMSFDQGVQVAFLFVDELEQRFP